MSGPPPEKIMIPEGDLKKILVAREAMLHELEPQEWKGPLYLDVFARREILETWLKRVYIAGRLAPPLQDRATEEEGEWVFHA